MKKLFIIASAITLAFNSCKKDDPVDPIIPNEEELITTLTLAMTPHGGGDVKYFTFQDLDGDGGNDPIISVDTLDSNTMYYGVVTLLNELENPPENITDEVEEEGVDHQFFYTTQMNNLMVDYDDLDDSGNPIGILTNIMVGDFESGKLTIVLRHEPNKEGQGVADGDITNAGGETDIEVTFDVEIK